MTNVNRRVKRVSYTLQVTLVTGTIRVVSVPRGLDGLNEGL